MQKNVNAFEFGRLVSRLAVATCLFAAPAEISAQGCMPLHFTTPSLGGQGIVFLHPHQWEVGLAARRVATHRFFVGDTENEAAAPFGQPLNLRLNSVDLSVSYAVTEKTSFVVTVPFSYNTAENANLDKKQHTVSNSGIGDISLAASMWLAAPSRRPTGNISLGLGVKAPNGGFHATGPFYGADGTVTQTPITPTAQLGDGGWAISGEGQAFQQVSSKASVYASAIYSASLRGHTDEVNQGLLVSVPDVYTARAGLGFALAPDKGLSVSLGGRIDGTRASDLIGGSDDYFRDAGYYMYVEPGLAWLSGLNQFTLSVPVRVRSNYFTTRLSNGTDRIGKGGVNDFIIYAGLSRRF